MVFYSGTVANISALRHEGSSLVAQKVDYKNHLEKILAVALAFEPYVIQQYIEADLGSKTENSTENRRLSPCQDHPHNKLPCCMTVSKNKETQQILFSGAGIIVTKMIRKAKVIRKLVGDENAETAS